MSDDPLVGHPVPAFSLPDDAGGETGPADFAGRTLVIYFYPKDDTSGCTLEAQTFSARIAEFEAAGATVLGISKDSIKSHCRFRDKHDLKIASSPTNPGRSARRSGCGWKSRCTGGNTWELIAPRSSSRLTARSPAAGAR